MCWEWSIPVWLSTTDLLLDEQVMFPTWASTQMLTGRYLISSSSMIWCEVFSMLPNFFFHDEPRQLYEKQKAYSCKPGTICNYQILWFTLSPQWYYIYILKHLLKKKVVFHMALSCIQVPFTMVNRVIGYSSKALRTRWSLTCWPLEKTKQNIKMFQKFLHLKFSLKS